MASSGAQEHARRRTKDIVRRLREQVCALAIPSLLVYKYNRFRGIRLLYEFKSFHMFYNSWNSTLEI